VAVVAAFFAKIFGQVAAELLQEFVQPLSVFRHMDSILFMELFGTLGYVVGFSAAAATLWAFTTPTQGQSFTEAIGLRANDLKTRKWKLLATGVLCYIGVMALTYALYAVAPLPAPQSPAGDEAKVLSGAPLNVFIFTAVILAPLFEETVFRGLLQNMLRAVFRGRGANALWARDLLAVVVTAAIFAAAHGTPTGFPVLFISGLMMGIAYWRTGSLWASMTVHFINNLVAVLLLTHGG
jgi:membrane protease YdiL (CAAX protease family)